MLDDDVGPLATDERIAVPVTLRFSEETFHKSWSAACSDWFVDALRTSSKVDDFTGGLGWKPGRGLSNWMLPQVEPGLSYFLQVTPSKVGMLYNGSGLWTASIEVKNARDVLGFDAGTAVPASMVVELQRACFAHAVDDGLIVTADSLDDANVTRLDATVDLNPGTLDISALLFGLSQMFDDSRLFRGKGANETLYLPRGKGVTTMLYDKQRERARFGIQVPPTLRCEVTCRASHLRPRTKGVSSVTDDTVRAIGLEQIQALGLDRDVSCRVVLLERARAAGLSEREILSLHSYLSLVQEGLAMSAPTRRKYRNLAKRLGVLGLLDGIDSGAYRFDWDEGLVSLVDA
jgi:hypothetical protein